MTLRDEFEKVAEEIPFDNSTNGFVSDNTQAAIEESKTAAEGFPRAGLVLTANGTVGDLSWITYSELLSNPRILFPQKIELKESTFTNSNINIRATKVVLYKNGQAAGNIVHTITLTAGQRTAGYGYYIFPTSIVFNPGDSLYAQVDYTATGNSLTDLALVLWIARVQ